MIEELLILIVLSMISMYHVGDFMAWIDERIPTWHYHLRKQCYKRLINKNWE
jgi:hypothetical protein